MGQGKRLTSVLGIAGLSAAMLGISPCASASDPADGTPRSDGVPMQFIPAARGMPFSKAVRAGDTLYLSGVLGADGSGKLVPGGIRGETQQAMQLIAQVLERNGSSMAQVAKCTVILADIKDFAAMNEVYVRHFPADRLPARTTFQAGALLDGARVEIECLADAGR